MVRGESLMEKLKYGKGSCLLCGSKEHEIVYDFERQDIVKCSSCGFAFVFPMPEDGHFQDVYAGDYWESYQVSVGEKDIHERLNEFMEISRERIGFLSKFKSKGKFLDVGCSMGFLVKAAKDAGFDAYGIDLSEKTLEEGRKRYNVKLIRSTLESYPPEKFDAITCYNTIEHVVRPDRLLIEMRKRLAADGVIAIGTHDFECSNHRKEGKAWKHIMPTEHLYYFRLRDLIVLGEQCGLEVVWHNKPIDNLIVVYYKEKKPQE